LALQTLFLTGGRNEVDYSAFLEQVRKGYVEAITVSDNVDVEGRYTAEAVANGQVRPAEVPRTFRQESPDQARRRFTTTKPSDHDLTEFLTEVNAAREDRGLPPIEFKAKYTGSWFGGLLNLLLFFGLIALFWVFILRRMGGPGQQVLNIGKN